MNAVETKKLSFAYPGKKVFENISFEAKQKSLTVLCGANGSGKTTLIKHLNGLIKPQKGQVRILGETTVGKKVSQLAKTVGIVFQNPDHQIFEKTVLAETMFGPKNLGLGKKAHKNAEKSLRLIGLWKHRLKHPATLSRGYRKRLAIASVLAAEPQIIVLDEPFMGQDQKGAQHIVGVLEKLKKNEKTIIVVTHQLDRLIHITDQTLYLSKKLEKNPEKIYGKMKLPQTYLLCKKLGIRPHYSPKTLAKYLGEKNVQIR